MNKEALEISFKVTERWIEYWQLQISSGAYKSRKVEKSVNGVYQQLSEDDLLKDTFGILHNHMHMLDEIADNLKGIYNR